MMNIYEQSTKIFVTSSIGSAFMKEGKANNACKQMSKYSSENYIQRSCCHLKFLRI